MLKLVAILDKLLWAIQSWVIYRDHKKLQEERNELESAPADWFSNHFSGLSDDNNNETNKTDS